MSSKLSMSLAALAVVATSAPAFAAGDPTTYLDVDQAKVLGTGVMATTMGSTANAVGFRYGLMDKTELNIGYGFRSGGGLGTVADGNANVGVKYSLGSMAGLNLAVTGGVMMPMLSKPTDALGYGLSLPIAVGVGGINLDVQPYLSGSTAANSKMGMGARAGVRQNLTTNLDLLVQADYSLSASNATVNTGLRYNLGGGGWLDLGLVNWNQTGGATSWGNVSLTYVGNR